MITQAEIKERLNYNPKTGIFIWIKPNPMAKKMKAGDVAGTKSKRDGYIRIKFNGKSYLAQRLAFLWMEGRFPKHQMDHDDRDRSNNKWDNLGELTLGKNLRNKSLYKNNSSGTNGIYFEEKSGKWRARIRVNNKMIHLGRFIEKDNAIKARKEAELKYNFTKTHGK